MCVFIRTLNSVVTYISQNVCFESMEMDEISISLQLPLDKDGFLRRECPHCGRQFKQWQDTRNDTEESPEAFYCPYCYTQADADSWFTAQQIEHIQQQTM